MPATAPRELDIEVTTTRNVSQEDVRHAREIVGRALAVASRPVRSAKVTLSVLADHAVPRPNLVSLQVDLNGLPVNAYAAAAAMPDAIDVAGARLRARVGHLAQYWEVRDRRRQQEAAAAG